MPLELWQIVVLAVVQGVTEFLPISSDGHLVIVARLMTPGGDAAQLEIPDLVIVLHAGTLLSIVVFYWRRILELLGRERRTAVLIAVATVPAVVLGLPMKLFAEEWLGSPLLAGMFLVVTGLVLVAARWARPGERDYREMGAVEAILIGVAQAAAILPGLSRSGCTITSALHLGFRPRDAATFSFLMAIPAIAGACVVETGEMIHAGQLTLPVKHLVVAIGVSFGVGLVSLWWLVRWLERGRFSVFAWWCIPAGIAMTAWEIFTRGA